MSKLIEIYSLDYETIDEIIERFTEYKKQYGGESTLTVDSYFEDDDDRGVATIYYGINKKEENE